MAALPVPDFSYFNAADDLKMADFSPSRPKRKMDSSSADVTPKKLKAATARIIGDDHLFSSPDRVGKKIIADGVEALNAMEASHADEKAQKIMHSVYSHLSKEDPGTVEFHKEAAEKLRTEGGFSSTGKSFVRGVVKKMKQSPLKVVPLKHMKELEATGGFHMEAPDSSHDIEVIAINPETNVKYALIDGKKFSTLFPETVDDEIVVDLVKYSRAIGKRGNQELRLADPKFGGYAIECYVSPDVVSYTSVFPVFMYEEFGTKPDYTLVAGVRISADEIMAAAQKQLATAEYYEIHDKSTGEIASVIVDIAPAFASQTRIQHGILFRFNKKDAPGLYDWEPKK